LKRIDVSFEERVVLFIGGKGEGLPVTNHASTGGKGVKGIYLLLNLGARQAWVVNATSRRLNLRERGVVTHFTGRCVDPRACLDRCEYTRKASPFTTNSEFFL
jgi:hypothetical protein